MHFLLPRACFHGEICFVLVKNNFRGELLKLVQTGLAVSLTVNKHQKRSYRFVPCLAGLLTKRCVVALSFSWSMHGSML